MQTSIRELKARLSELIRGVEQGATVTGRQGRGAQRGCEVHQASRANRKLIRPACLL